MASRARAALKAKPRAGAGLPSAPRSGAPSPAPRPLLYTAQDVARCCEVDLKTIHHWAIAGKIPHHRTAGRHLRFRHNHVVQFLRAHGYPLGPIASARPAVFFAPGARADEELVMKRLATRFFVRRFDSGLAAIAHLVAGQPDALVLALADATWAGEHALLALKGDPATSWTTVVVLAEDGEPAPRGADLVLAPGDLARLPAELAESLGVG